MNWILKNQKGFSLLIMVIQLAAFLFIIEVAFLGMFQGIFQRVNYEKRKQLVLSLVDMGVVYAHSMENKHYGLLPDKIFPEKRLKIEQIKENPVIKRYTYSSPPLIKSGYFILQYDYLKGAKVKLLCTGYFEGVTFSCEIK